MLTLPCGAVLLASVCYATLPIVEMTPKGAMGAMGVGYAQRSMALSTGSHI